MGRILRGALVLAAIGVVAFVVWTVAAGDDEPTVREAPSNRDGLSVADAINRAPKVAFAVRGFIVDDGAFVQLCERIVLETPPKCAGSVLLLRNLDLARVNLEERGGVRYTAEPVILGGRVDGTQLSVVDVLAATEE
jgi:hypothetical protein